MPTGFPDYYGGLTLPVTVAEGGTGKTTVTLHALLCGNGTGAMIETNVGTGNQFLYVANTGGTPAFTSWPVPFVLTTIRLNPTITGSGLDLHGSTVPTVTPQVGFYDDTSSAYRGHLYMAESAGIYCTTAMAGDIGLLANTGRLLLSTQSIEALRIDQLQIVTLAHPLAVTSGGTGTATPALVAGTGITITGTWPDNTITNSSAYAALADPLPVAHGGTGTATPALVAGTGITLSGTWPNNTITNSSAYAALADPLPVGHGGTGTATPALVQGSNIAITGSWPNNTIATTANLSAGTFVSTAGGGSVAFANVTDIAGARWVLVETNEWWNWYNDTAAGVVDALTVAYNSETFYHKAYIDTGGVVHAVGFSTAAGGIIAGGSLTLSTPLAVAYGGTGTATPALVAGTGITLSGTWPNNTITNSSAYAALADPLPVAHGGTGTTSLLAAGIPQIVKDIDLTGQTASIGSTQFFTPPANGQYRITIAAYLNSPTGTSTLDVAFIFVQNGSSFTFTPLAHISITTTLGVGSDTRTFYTDAGVPFQYATTFTNGGGADSYDLHIRIEAL